MYVCIDLQDVVWVVQQWLFYKRKAENPVQFLRLDVSAVLPWHWSPGQFLESSWKVYIRILKKLNLILSIVYRMGDLVSKSEGKQAKVRFSSSTSFYMGCRRRLWPRFRVSVPASNNLIKELHYQKHPPAWCQLGPDVVILPAKMSHHKHLTPS